LSRAAGASGRLTGLDRVRNLIQLTGGDVVDAAVDRDPGPGRAGGRGALRMVDDAYTVEDTYELGDVADEITGLRD